MDTSEFAHGFDTRTADFGEMAATIHELGRPSPEISVSCNWGDGF